MKDISDELAQRFVDAAMEFAADLVETISSIDEEFAKTKESRMARRMKCRQDFVDAYWAIKELGD